MGKIHPHLNRDLLGKQIEACPEIGIQCPIYFSNSHFELASLPTGGWGYDHFPFSARYAITQPRDFLGMTGEFHSTWGEFGGFKRPAALRYECAAMIAQGAKCSIGDQLHPSGEMNPDTYALIGEAYREVESCEPWAREVTHAARIAIISSDHPQDQARGHGASNPADEGVARMLLELYLPFVVLDEAADGVDFDVVILADGFVLTAESLAKARAFLKNGGRILGAGSAFLTPDKSAFALDPEARLLGRSPFNPDYLLATNETPDVPVRSPILIEDGAWEIEPTTATVFQNAACHISTGRGSTFVRTNTRPMHPNRPPPPRSSGMVWFTLPMTSSRNIASAVSPFTATSSATHSTN